MASRSSASGTMLAFNAVLGLAALVLFVLWIIFMSKYQGADRDLKAERQQNDEYVRAGERQQDTILRVRDLAQRENKSVVGYLNDTFRQTMQRATGNRNATFAEFERRLSSIDGASSADMLALISQRDADIRHLREQLDAANAARVRAQEDLAAETARVEQLMRSQRETISRLNNDILGYKQEVEDYRQEIVRAKAEMEARIARVTQEYATREEGLNERLSDSTRKLLEALDRVRQLQGEKRGDSLRPTTEYALVDGEVIGLSAVEGEVVIGLGRRDKLPLGIKFTVYDDAAAIRPNAQGEYPRGKAVLEVINIGEDFATCKVVPGTTIRGNPVVKGDVVANAIYDPRKVYRFVVFGDFDTNNDGRSTERERADIVALINAWGGQVVPELDGSVDFLVLGDRPVVPPAPPANAPIEVVRQYYTYRQQAESYDQMYRQAVETSLPTLNQNRLYTLTGGRTVIGR